MYLYSNGEELVAVHERNIFGSPGPVMVPRGYNYVGRLTGVSGELDIAEVIDSYSALKEWAKKHPLTLEARVKELESRMDRLEKRTAAK